MILTMTVIIDIKISKPRASGDDPAIDVIVELHSM